MPVEGKWQESCNVWRDWVCRGRLQERLEPIVIQYALTRLASAWLGKLPLLPRNKTMTP
jgi:hypothetical protein